MARATDYGVNDKTFITHTHLGEFINFNDTVLCYDLNECQIEEIENYDISHKHALPDVIIVKKTYPKTRKRQNKRIWKINRLGMEKLDENDIWAGRKKGKKHEDAGVPTGEQDMNEFLNDIEENPDMRANITLYKDTDVID